MPDESAHHLVVKLGDLVTGEIELHGNTVRFTPNPAYAASRPRPVLGQIFEDEPDRVRSTHLRLPPWFSNLLPEKDGPLRGIVARQLGIHPGREFHMIAALGHDLPGAATVEADDELTVAEPTAVETTEPGPLDGVPLKFSLAGVQLKLSILRDHRGLTFPASGDGGNWIVKLPFHALGHVPENEFSMMTWLKESGVEVPRIDLLTADQVHGVPPDLVEPGARVFAIERFDRSPAGRHHIEDFAQIFDVYPERKYQQANYESIGRVLLNIAGAAAVREFVHRLVAVVLIGNGDAHLKNWSVRYLDPRQAELSPAYDFVSTVVYRQFHGDTMALNLDRSKEFAKVTAGTFRHFGERIGYPDPAELETLAASFADRMRTTWFAISAELPMPAEMTKLISSRLLSLPLLRDSP
jgi:serine/threonine-protein kinase HipA